MHDSANGPSTRLESGVGPLRRVWDALLGRSGRLPRGPRVRLRATVPMMAFGALGVFALQGWNPDRLIGPPVAIEVAAPQVELPMEVNTRVEKWMRRFMTDQKGMFETFLARENRFAGMIRGKLRERGMPEDLLYLAMVESGFSPRATSKKEAVGVWQFIPPTATQYGLRVDEWVDERRDPVKATDAALDYLSSLHDRYGSWYLAAAAYNAGPSRVDRAIKRLGAARRGDEDVYWQIIDQLPKETREYVPKILAATTLARQAERYGFHVKPAAPYEYDRVWVPGGTGLGTIAHALEVETSVVRELNPHLKLGVAPPGGSYAVRVPAGSTSLVIAALGGRPATTFLAD